MIQIILMDGSKYVNEYKNFKAYDDPECLKYIALALKNKSHSIIEISKWKNNLAEKNRKKVRG